MVLGNLKSLNELAKQARADHIIHTGDFGFYDDSSLERIAEKYVFFFSFLFFWTHSLLQFHKCTPPNYAF